MKILILGVALATAASVYGCSHDDGHTHGSSGTSGSGGHVSDYPTCQAIIDKCHELDVGEGAIHDCHDVAHEAKGDDVCVAKKAECDLVCVPDAGAADGGSDAGRD